MLIALWILSIIATIILSVLFMGLANGASKTELYEEISTLQIERDYFEKSYYKLLKQN
jgi:type II secretory pathway pseudopilin PulG